MMENGFSKIHPVPSFLYFIGSIVASMIFNHPIYLYTLFIISILLNWSLDGGKVLNKGIKGYLFIAVVITVLNPLFSRRGATILFYIMDQPVTLESIVYGVQLAISLLTILFLFTAYHLVITPDKFLYIFGSVLPKTAFIMTIILRFIPLLKRRLVEIISLQKIHGSFQQKDKKRIKMKQGMETLHTLVTWSLEEALETASSMRARGYGVGKRSSAIHYKMGKKDALIMGVLFVVGLFVLISGLLGIGRYEVYPQIQKVELTTFMIFHFLCFFICSLIPLFLIAKERIEWFIIKSKM